MIGEMSSRSRALTEIDEAGRLGARQSPQEEGR
jgi:hypothetical protein